MVNISSIGDCGVIIQLYSLYIAPVMVNSSSLGCSNVISLPVVVNIITFGGFENNICSPLSNVRIHIPKDSQRPIATTAI